MLWELTSPPSPEPWLQWGAGGNGLTEGWGAGRMGFLGKRLVGIKDSFLQSSPQDGSRVFSAILSSIDDNLSFIPNFQGVVDPGNLKTPFSHANKNSKIIMFHCLFLPALQKEVMTSLSRAFSAPRSHYIRTVLMGSEHVERGVGGTGTWWWVPRRGHRSSEHSLCHQSP